MYEEFIRTNNSLNEYPIRFVRPDGSISHVMSVKDVTINHAIAYGRKLSSGTNLSVFQGH